MPAVTVIMVITVLAVGCYLTISLIRLTAATVSRLSAGLALRATRVVQYIMVYTTRGSVQVIRCTTIVQPPGSGRRTIQNNRYDRHIQGT